VQWYGKWNINDRQIDTADWYRVCNKWEMLPLLLRRDLCRAEMWRTFKHPSGTKRQFLLRATKYNEERCRRRD